MQNPVPPYTLFPPNIRLRRLDLPSPWLVAGDTVQLLSQSLNVDDARAAAKRLAMEAHDPTLLMDPSATHSAMARAQAGTQQPNFQTFFIDPPF